jgi:hypothetical protein
VEILPSYEFGKIPKLKGKRFFLEKVFPSVEEAKLSLFSEGKSFLEVSGDELTYFSGKVEFSP